MKLPAWITAAASAVFAVLPGCDYVNMQEMKPGVTTQAEVRSRMGEPGFVHRNDDGTVTWEYARQPEGTNCYMITFDSKQIISKVEQVLNEANYGKVRPGMSQDDIRRLFGAPARKQVFDNLREEIWEWRIEGMPPMEETYFMVHFDTATGGVKKTSKRIQPRG